MSNVSITFHEANKRYPKVVQQVLQTRNQSRSKSKGAPLSDLTWSLSWCTMIGTSSFADILNRLSKPPEPKKVLTLDEELTAECARVTNIGLVATSKSNNRASWSALIVPDRTPAEIVKVIRDALIEQREEEKRVNALTPAQRTAEINEALAELAKGSGFMAINIPVQEDPQ